MKYDASHALNSKVVNMNWLSKHGPAVRLKCVHYFS